MSWRTLIEFNHDLADANDLTDLLAEVFRNAVITDITAAIFSTQRTSDGP